MNKDNTPTFNVNRKISNFKDFNKESEKEELGKLKRQSKPNSTEQQYIGNKKYKFNKVTHKMDEITPSEIDDFLEESKKIKDDENDDGWWFDEYTREHGHSTIGHEPCQSKTCSFWTSKKGKKLKKKIEIESNGMEEFTGESILPFGKFKF